MNSLTLLALVASTSRKLPTNNDVYQRSKYYCHNAGCRYSCDKIYKLALHQQRHQNNRKKIISTRRIIDQDLRDVQDMMKISSHSRLKALVP